MKQHLFESLIDEAKITAPWHKGIELDAPGLDEDTLAKVVFDLAKSIKERFKELDAVNFDEVEQALQDGLTSSGITVLNKKYTPKGGWKNTREEYPVELSRFADVNDLPRQGKYVGDGN